MEQPKDIIKDVETAVEVGVDSKTPDKLSDIPHAEDALDKALAQLPAGQQMLKKLAEDATADLISKGKGAGKEWVERRIDQAGNDFMKSFEQYTLSPDQQKLAISALAIYIDAKYSQADQTATIAIHNLGKNLGVTTEISRDSGTVSMTGDKGSITVEAGKGWKGAGVTVETRKAGLGVTTGEKVKDTIVATRWHGEKLSANVQMSVDSAAEAAISAFGGRVNASASGNLREGALDSASLQTELGKIAVGVAAVDLETDHAQYAVGSLSVNLGNQQVSLYAKGGAGENPSFEAQYTTKVAEQNLNLTVTLDKGGICQTTATMDTSAATLTASYNSKTGQVTTGITRKF